MGLFPSGNFSQPLLRVRGSGLGGSGYRNPFDGATLGGVTSVLDAVDKPAIRQWAVDQTAAYAVANIDALLNRTEEQGWGFLRWYHKRKPDLEADPLRNYHVGVLNDAAELGTAIHSYIEQDLAELPLPPITSPEMDEMVGVWQDFKWLHTIRPVAIEGTVLNRSAGYGGTFDLIWELDGQVVMTDIKSSRHTWETHWAQQSALGAAEELAILCDKKDADGQYRRTAPDGWDGPVGKDGNVTTYWRSEPVPAFSGYKLLHVRPSDVSKDGEPMEPFCRLVDSVDEGVDMDAHYDLFLGALAVRKAQKRIKGGSK